MKKTIYIIIQDCSDDYDRSVEVKPYGSLDEARAEFKTLTDNRRVDATNLGRKILQIAFQHTRTVVSASIIAT